MIKRKLPNRIQTRIQITYQNNRLRNGQKEKQIQILDNENGIKSKIMMDNQMKENKK
jgi:hypothetical protein